jgi:hypothetical protein
MIALLTLPRGEGIPWPAAERPPRDLRRPVPVRPGHEEPHGIVIRPGAGAG